MRTFNPQEVPPPKQSHFFVSQLTFPLNIEIGAGTGDFAIKWALEHPQETLIAIEKTREKFEKFKKKYIEHGQPDNLYPVHANAINFITHYLPQHCIKKCFINYPNPYPKKSQANKRFHNMPFMNFLRTRFIRGGQLEYASNLQGLISEAKASLTHEHDFLLINQLQVSSVHLARTAFEKKYTQRGETCYRLTFSV